MTRIFLMSHLVTHTIPIEKRRLRFFMYFLLCPRITTIHILYDILLCPRRYMRVDDYCTTTVLLLHRYVNVNLVSCWKIILRDIYQIYV